MSQRTAAFIHHGLKVNNGHIPLTTFVQICCDSSTDPTNNRGLPCQLDIGTGELKWSDIICTDERL